MFSDMLIDNIYDYITIIGLVPEEQVYRMFKENHTEQAILWSIKQLIIQNKVNYEKDTKMLSRRSLLSTKDMRYKLRSKAAWVLANIGESETMEYCSLEYPIQTLIVTKDNSVYDVITFTEDNIDSLMITLPKRWDSIMKVPEEVEDETVHIAFLDDKDMAEQVRKLKLFDTYCFLDKDNNVQYFE